MLLWLQAELQKEIFKEKAQRADAEPGAVLPCAFFLLTGLANSAPTRQNVMMVTFIL